MNKSTHEIYSVYLSEAAVELLPFADTKSEVGRLICSQINYRNILEFATKLAQKKQIPLRNHVELRH